MHFGQQLKRSIYPPWKDHYIDYAKLKELLRETDGPHEETSDDWTEEDEGAFVNELVNVQLDKVNDFQVDTSKQLRERTSKGESELEELVASDEKARQDGGDKKLSDHDRQEKLQAIQKKLDNITKETNELEKFSRINFTGFLKAAKKHDRKRGLKYRVRPLLQVRLAALPFNSEDYSPLLYRLSAMYAFIRENLEGQRKQSLVSTQDSYSDVKKYTSYKFWVHPDNLLEVKIRILRRLPVLVYNPQTSKVAEGTDSDPSITSVYFDNHKFALYTQKVDRAPNASSLRLRWFGQLKEKPDISFEKKVAKDDDNSEEIRFSIKEKYVRPFIKGEYKMEKTVKKLQDRQGQRQEDVDQFEQHVDEIQKFIGENQLQPMLRANYTRTAFQIPGDDRVRISLDTDLALIREDSLDADRPCRDAEDWHRTDIDNAEMEYPFASIRKGEINRFPFALLEIKMRDSAKTRAQEWVSDLMVSHLVKEAPRFSKFVHGTAQLFEDHVNSFPFWLSEVDSDIRRDPGTAFEEEQQKKAQKAEDEFAVGSFAGSKSSPAFRAVGGSPANKSRKPSPMLGRSIDIGAKSPALSAQKMAAVSEPGDSDEDVGRSGQTHQKQPSGLSALFPSFSSSKYAQAHQHRGVQLPPGVREPGQLIKDSGPVRVEAKVWLANQRTFIKWQHVSILLVSLSLGLYNAAGKTNNVARALAVVYTLVAIFAAGWGWAMYIHRSRLIQQRSGKDFDNVVGPVIVCLGLVVALCLNFGFKYQAAIERTDPGNGHRNETDSNRWTVQGTTS